MATHPQPACAALDNLLFKSLPLNDKDSEEKSLRVKGDLPPWLHGALFRNGPGAWEPAGTESHGLQQNHLFDGYAIIHKFSIDGKANTVNMARRFIESRSLRAAKEGRMLREFGTDPCHSIFGRMKTLFHGVNGNEAFSDNTNVVVTALAGELVALTEVPLGYRLDAQTLATLGPFTGSPEQEPLAWNEVATIVSAHRLFHPTRKMHVTVATRFVPPLYFYDVVMVPEDRSPDEALYGPHIPQPGAAGTKASVSGKDSGTSGSVGSIHRCPVSHPAYQHSFALTEDFVIMTEHPMLFSVPSLLRTILGGAPITDMFPWQPSDGTFFRVVHLGTGEQVARIPAPTMFTFHHVNAFQRQSALSGDNDSTNDGRPPSGFAGAFCRRTARGAQGSDEAVRGVEIVLDLIAYDSPGVIHDFTMDNLRAGVYGGPNTKSCLRRFVLKLDAGTATEEPGMGFPVLPVISNSGEERLPPPVGKLGADVFLELPSIHPGRLGQAYRFAYAVRASSGCMMDGLLKLDMQGKTAAEWRLPGCLPSEPVFVPRPAAEGESAPEEDDGVVLSLVLDEARRTSFLLVLDARTFTESARCTFPEHAYAPMSFHGTYLRAQATSEA